MNVSLQKIIFLVIFSVGCSTFAQSSVLSKLVQPKPAASATGTAAVNPDEDKKTLSAIPTAADDERNQKTLNSLLQQADWFPDLKITVAHGLVLIEGKTKNREQLEWLAKTADRLPTVIAVINKATLIETSASDFTPAVNEFKALVERAKKTLPAVGLTVLCFALFMFLGRGLHRSIDSLWHRRIDNPFLRSTVSKITMLPIWLFFFYFTMEIAGLSKLATTIIGGTGVLGIVFGFAFKDIAENYLSGLILAFRSPFTKGDLIQVSTYQGYVQSLDMRGTTIIDFDGNLILIPNTMVIQSVIQNQTANPTSRLSFTIAISYNESVARAQELLTAAVASVPGILPDPAPMVVASDVSGGNINLKVYFWYDAVKSSSLRVKSLALAKCQTTLIQSGFSVSTGNTSIVFGSALDIRQAEVLEKHTITPSLKHDMIETPKSEPKKETKHEQLLDKEATRKEGGKVDHDHGEELKKLADKAVERNPNLKSDLLS